MLIKLIRPLFEGGWNTSKLVSFRTLSTSNVLFQHSFSGTNTGGSAKPTEKAPDLKNQKQSGEKNKDSTGLDNEQERSQQEGPADKGAERKASSANDKSTKSKK